jgi:hypothetical protein
MGKKILAQLKKEWFWLGILLVGYLVLSALTFGRRLDYLNSDGVAYLRLAGYLASGNFWHSVSGYWSPLFIWLIAPFQLIGFSGPVAAKLVLAIAGLGLVIAAWFMTARFALRLPFRILSGIIIVLAAVFWNKFSLTPDLLLAALLALYFFVITSSDILTSPRRAALAGVFGGLAFLSKAFALPFIFVHLPISFLVLWYFKKGPDGQRTDWKKVVKVGLVGMGVFLAIVAVWTSVLTAKYGRMLVSPSGTFNHALFKNGIDGMDNPVVQGLYEPESWGLNVWEDPLKIPVSDWSAFESVTAFRHQLAIIFANVGFEVKLLQYDFLGLGFWVLLFLLLAIFIKTERRTIWAWTLLTALLYLSGYSLIMTDPGLRFFWGILVLLIIALFSLTDKVFERFWRRGLDQKLTALAIVGAVFFSFAYQAGRDVKYLLLGHNPGINYAGVAAEIKNIDTVNRLAASEWHPGLFVGYYLPGPVKYLGVPRQLNDDGLAAELKNARVDTFLVWGEDPALARRLTAGRWHLTKKIKPGDLPDLNQMVSVYNSN